eukprot:gnl/MRDRNA2_/MRDRNA2_152486_c0_seq1.p1 gnl/MRDRNA2_/MRDRNA2_152486_c0~~gnl/MRDRNA2_/MRDRNA2_152486_c0_seq1.p1  ORF type:complete len:377 (+),score=76.77 gnl/MRDRNA2_/MRDRNA2_152486_c0_seq1:81-1211(+)
MRLSRSSRKRLIRSLSVLTLLPFVTQVHAGVSQVEAHPEASNIGNIFKGHSSRKRKTWNLDQVQDMMRDLDVEEGGRRKRHKVSNPTNSEHGSKMRLPGAAASTARAAVVAHAGQKFLGPKTQEWLYENRAFLQALRKRDRPVAEKGQQESKSQTPAKITDESISTDEKQGTKTVGEESADSDQSVGEAGLEQDPIEGRRKKLGMEEQRGHAETLASYMGVTVTMEWPERVLGIKKKEHTEAEVSEKESEQKTEEKLFANKWLAAMAKRKADKEKLPEQQRQKLQELVKKKQELRKRMYGDKALGPCRLQDVSPNSRSTPAPSQRNSLAAAASPERASEFISVSIALLIGCFVGCGASLSIMRFGQVMVSGRVQLQ